MTGIAIVRTSNDQIVEEHANSDALGLLTQIGITQSPSTSLLCSFKAARVPEMREQERMKQ